MSSRIPSRSRPHKQEAPLATVSPASTRLVLSTPPEILSWLVDELGYVHPPSSSSSRARPGGEHWSLATEGKELRESDVTRACRGSVHILLHHLSLHMLGRQKVAHIRSEIHRLQSSNATSHLSRPTLQTLFPANSTHQAHLASLAAVQKLDSRLASLQANLDASLVDARTTERTDEEILSLKMRRDVLEATGKRWKEGMSRLDGLSQILDSEGGRDADRYPPSEAEQKSDLDNLLASLSSYIVNPSTYTKPDRIVDRLLRISPDMVLETLRSQLDHALDALARSTPRTDPQNAKDALMELHRLHVALSKARPTSPRPSRRVHLETQLYQKLKPEYGDDKVGLEKKRTEILSRIDAQADRRLRSDLASQLGRRGQELLSGREESKAKLNQLEADRITLIEETSSLQATYDALVASSQALATESHRLSADVLPASLASLQGSLAALEGLLERELGTIGREPWAELVLGTLGCKVGESQRELAALLGKGQVDLTFVSLRGTLDASLKEQESLQTLQRKLLVKRPTVEGQADLIANHLAGTSAFNTTSMDKLSPLTNQAREDIARTTTELDKARTERDALASGALLRKTRTEIHGSRANTRR